MEHTVGETHYLHSFFPITLPRSDGEKDGSDPILTRRHFAERLDGTGKM